MHNKIHGNKFVFVYCKVKFKNKFYCVINIYKQMANALLN